MTMGAGFGGPQMKNPPPRAQVLFVEASVTTQQATPTASTNGLAVEGTWCFTLKPKGRKPRGRPGLIKLRNDYLNEVEVRRYKVGFKIKQGQTVEEFSFQGTAGWFQMVADGAVTGSLNALLPPGSGELWAGFIPPVGAHRKARWSEGLTVCYRFRLAVSPLATPPQAIASLITYQDLAFNTHHLKSVILVSDKEKKIRTATRALVP
jgi:hypothetical protein